jgi:hypothetical protein
MEWWHHLAHRALVVTKPRCRARWSTTGWGGTDRAGAGRPWSGRAGVKCGATGAASPGPGGAVRGVAGVAVRGALGGGDGARGSDEREREKREKERAGSSTIPTYVHRADTSVDGHKQASLRGGRSVLCSSATRRTYVTYVGFKLTNVI